MTDEFLKYNLGRVDDRTIDTLIGLSKGLIADKKINQTEAEFMLNWLGKNRSYATHPMFHNLYEKVNEFLSDGVLDDEESKELLTLLRKISGEESEPDEMFKPTTLPLDEPAPEIVFQDQLFLFTGTCAFGIRKKCKEATESLGGSVASNVNKSLNYLVIGSYVTESWIHESFGRKIEKAVEYRNSGLPLKIVTEDSWALAGGFIPSIS